MLTACSQKQEFGRKYRGVVATKTCVSFIDSQQVSAWTGHQKAILGEIQEW
jgi:hypothetical protein